MPRFDVSKFLDDTAHDLRAIKMKPSQLMLDIVRRDNEFFLPAIHEAGHAVAAWALWHSVEVIDLRSTFSEEDERVTNVTRYRLDLSAQDKTSSRLRAEIGMIALAGLLTERTLLPDRQAEFEWDGDLEHAVDAVNAINPGLDFDKDAFEMVLEDAELLVEEHKERIVVLAVAAIRFGPILEGSEIEAILNGLESDDWKELIA